MLNVLTITCVNWYSCRGILTYLHKLRQLFEYRHVLIASSYIHSLKVPALRNSLELRQLLKYSIGRGGVRMNENEKRRMVLDDDLNLGVSHRSDGRWMKEGVSTAVQFHFTVHLLYRNNYVI